MKQMMLDLETWATSVDAEIRSIGAVVFEFDTTTLLNHAYIFGGFYCNVLPQFERAQSDETRNWWYSQPHETQAVFNSPAQIEMKEALYDLARFYRESNCDRIWSHGATFDVPIIEHAMKAYGVTVPWKYSHVRDTRTLYEHCDVSVISHPGYEMKHNAWHDAYNQAMAVLTCKMKTVAR